MNREHLIITIARLHETMSRIRAVDFGSEAYNNLRDELCQVADKIHSIPRSELDKIDSRIIYASHAEQIAHWMHCLEESKNDTVNQEIIYIVSKLASHWGISDEHNVLLFAHGDFAVRHFPKEPSALHLNVIESIYKVHFSREPRILYIPKFYDGDMLFTSILFHEVGHMVDRDNAVSEIIYQKIENIIKNKPKSKVVVNYFKDIIDNRTMDVPIVKSHIREYIADLFCCQYLGEHALHYVAYKESNQRNADRVDHPTFACRERLISSFLSYMKSPTCYTDDVFLKWVIEEFENIKDIDNLGKHFDLVDWHQIIKDNHVTVDTEDKLFSLLANGWSIALLGQQSVERERQMGLGTLSISDYYRLINNLLKQGINEFIAQA